MYYVFLCHYIRILHQRIAQGLSTVKMDAVCTYETSVPTQYTTLLHNPGQRYSMCW